MALTTRALPGGAILLGVIFHVSVIQASRSVQVGAAPTVILRAPAAAGPGATLFRERCAECHGADAKGERGPNLTGLWTADVSGAMDERVFQTIRTGVPGSIMPPSQAPDDEIRAIIRYLRSLSMPGWSPVRIARHSASVVFCSTRRV